MKIKELCPTKPLFVHPGRKGFCMVMDKKTRYNLLNESILFSIKRKSCTQSHKNGSRPISVGQLPFKV
jgi:hypothetical protein